jgi:predicted AAA+ superfamily ATPase
MTRSAKTYIRDTGLLHCLQRRRSLDDISVSGSAQGHSWETFCIEHIIRAAPHADAYFYRDDDQNEIDLVLEFSRTQRFGIEIKSEGGQPRSGFDAALRTIAPATGYVVRPIPESITSGRYPILTLSDMIKTVSDHHHWPAARISDTSKVS